MTRRPAWQNVSGVCAGDGRMSGSAGESFSEKLRPPSQTVSPPFARAYRTTGRGCSWSMAYGFFLRLRSTTKTNPPMFGRLSWFNYLLFSSDRFTRVSQSIFRSTFALLTYFTIVHDTRHTHSACLRRLEKLSFKCR